ncbi:MAG: carboxymuconolactone decarboxylase family protein [SAR202 cluster bacterium]|nr:carboxymuconolactone decarboxylase family protein [SAR202 cluster bacterium]
MPRVPTVSREKVPAKHQKTFDEIVSTRGRGNTVDSGPGSIMINSPEMAKRANQLSGYLRRESTLSKRVQELAMITTARAMDCQYIWNAHAASARKEGVSEALVDALRDKKPLPRMTAEEAAVVNYGLEFYKTHRVSQTNFQAALDQFGAQGLTELTTLMGYYALLAFNANAFQIDLPAQRTEKVLPV